MNKKNAEEECNSFKCFRKESVSRMRRCSRTLFGRNSKAEPKKNPDFFG
jgi:hypothetical protein